MMADAYGKLTGRPGICFVTRGSRRDQRQLRCTHRRAGLHAHDPVHRTGCAPHAWSARRFRRSTTSSFFGGMAKWVVEVDDPARFPETHRTRPSGSPCKAGQALSSWRCLRMSLSKKPNVADAARVEAVEIWPGPPQIAELNALVAAAARPLVLLGGFALD